MRLQVGLRLLHKDRVGLVAFSYVRFTFGLWWLYVRFTFIFVRCIFGLHSVYVRFTGERAAEVEEYVEDEDRVDRAIEPETPS